MKAKALTTLAGLVLAITMTANAGTSYTDTTTQVTSSGATGSLWQWFVGGSGGYLLDDEEPMYHVQLGVEFANPGSTGVHSVFLEVGFSQADSDFSYDPGLPGARSEFASIDVDLLPVTLNYKYEGAINDRFNYYLGAGIGVAFTDVSYRWGWSQAVPPPDDFFEDHTDSSDALLYGQLFAGLSYEITDAFVVFGGARYILMDEENHSIDVTDVSDYGAGIDGDVLLEVGAHYRF